MTKLFMSVCYIQIIRVTDIYYIEILPSIELIYRLKVALNQELRPLYQLI